MILICTSLLFVASLVKAQPEPCTSPSQWVATLIQEDEKNLFTTRGKYYYDAINQRERYVVSATFGFGDPLDTLILVKEQLQYIYNQKTGLCLKYNISGYEWMNVGVPQGAKYEGSRVIGSSAVQGVNIKATTWSANFPNSNDQLSYFGMFSTPSCLPLTIALQSKNLGRITNNLFDITPGINDPNAFTPPSKC